MSSDPNTVRRLEAPDDAARFRGIRLEALRSSPEAFGSDFESESARPSEWFAERLRTSAVFGCLADEILLGVAGLVVHSGAKRCHKGALWGVYVTPAARAGGIGRRLVEAAVDAARGRVELVQLSVTSTNLPARRLYAALGFRQYGLERAALKVDGRYFDNVLMALDLKPG